MALQSFQADVDRRDDARYHGGLRVLPINMIVWHCTAGDRAADAISWLQRTLKAGEGPAGYHYIVDKAPKPHGLGIVRLLPVELVAYHAGWSSDPRKCVWTPSMRTSVNSKSIGISFANDNGSDANTADDALTDYQRQAGLWLGVTLCRLNNVPAEGNFGHREVSPGRKTDPLSSILNMDDWRAQIAAALKA